MTKSILSYILVGLILLAITFLAHSFVVNQNNINHPFSLFDVYLFQGSATIFICVVFEIINRKVKQLSDQLGFIYLGVMVLKIVIFCIVFKSVVFSDIQLTKIDSASLLIPIFIFLFFEVYVIAKILNREA